MTVPLTTDFEPVKFAKYVYDAEGHPEQIVWDVSSIENLIRCSKYYQYNNLKGMRLSLPPTATYFGSAVHHGFEVLDTVRFYGGKVDEAVEQAVDTILTEYGEGLRLSTDNARSLQPALRAVVWRAEEFWDDPLETVAMPDGKPALEVRFEVPLAFIDQPYRLSGRIDKMVEHNGDLYIVDTKTTKKVLNSWFFDGYMPSTQIYGYMWVCREILKLPIRGFIIDAVQTMVESTRFGRATFDVTPEQIDEWKSTVKDGFQRLVEYKNQQNYPHNYASCGNYGGCVYRKVCAAPEWMRPTYIEDSYKCTTHFSLETDNE
tara:strand:- start:11899 stop:12849 length:951 start_codon:yes stop_codon:yes gene_type:complete